MKKASARHILVSSREKCEELKPLKIRKNLSEKYS